MEQIANYINGQLVPAISGRYLENIEPATGLYYSQVPDSDDADLDNAVESALTAFDSWSNKTISERSNILSKISDLITDNLAELALAESIDTGKPLAVTQQVDIPRAASNFQFFSTAIQHFFSESHSMGSEAINYTLRVPLGVVGCISPWNLPLYLFTWKVAPALAIGNTVVAKPSELAPVTAYRLSRICIEAGLPPGVLNIVHGLGSKVGQHLVEHPMVQAISFTGGTKTGAQIAKTVAPLFKKVSLELGGKNPNIVFADCQFNQAISGSLRSSFFNQGQICLAGSRIYIEKPLYQQFKNEFIRKIQSLKVSDPLEEECRQGAVISLNHLQKIFSYIELAQQEGGKIISGGKRVFLTGRCENGFFIEPTVIEGLAPDCQTNQQEIFGPVVTLTPFEHEDEVLEYANRSVYGLSASIWSENITRCHRLSSQIQAGIIWVNCWMIRDLRTPFGGMKQSGMGREGGFEVLRFFTEAKNVCVYTGE